MKRVPTLAISIVVFAMFAFPQHGKGQRPSGTAMKFIGMWRLISIVDSKGLVAPDRGEHPTGFIVYDPSGNMAVQIMPDLRLRRKYAAAEPTLEEAKAALSGYTAYFGTWTVDEKAGTITHHLKGNINPRNVETDNVRKYEFGPGDRVTLITPGPTPESFGGIRLTWEKVK
jgi:hypothetical protein